MSTTSDDDLPHLEQDDNDVAEGWDCTTLLDQAAVEEAAFSMQYPSNVVDFGHPDPPKLAIFPVFSRNVVTAAATITTTTTTTATTTTSTTTRATASSSTRNEGKFKRHFEPQPLQPTEEEVVLIVAYTDHCVVAQALQNGPLALSSQVLTIGSLPVLDHDSTAHEEITCLTVVARESLAFLDPERKSKVVVTTGNLPDSEQPTHSDDPQRELDCIPMDTTPDDDTDHGLDDPNAMPLPQEFSIAIVLGTTHARVYAAEVLVTLTTWHENVLEATLTFSPTMVSRDANFVEVLPRDDEETLDILNRYERKHRGILGGEVSVQPFTPSGRVLSITPFRFKKSSGPLVADSFGSYLWIAYQDGALVRIYHAAVFPSVWEIGASRQVSIEELLQPVAGYDPVVGGNPVVRCQLMLPPQKKPSDLQIIPLPRYHPSPLAPLPVLSADLETESAVSSLDDTLEGTNATTEFFEALVFGDKDDPLTPTLVFYSSEDQFVGRIKGDIDIHELNANRSETFVSSVVGSTKAVMEGVLRWGLGSSRKVSRSSSLVGGSSSLPETNLSASEIDYKNEELPFTPFPSLWRRPIALYAGHEFHDAPREIESCVVDPSGRLCALTDSLGRVLLVDLSTKQVVRMWKGFRETTCHWIQSDGKHGSATNAAGIFPTTHLAIHSRHRRVVEIWRIRQGPRVLLTQVGRDAMLVSSPMLGRCDKPSNRVQTFMIQSMVPGSGNQIERIRLPKPQQKGSEKEEDIASVSQGSSSALPLARGAALRLQHLRQLLSAKDLDYSKSDILDAVRKIKSLGDLSTALDLISTASVLEDRLGVEGSSFQKSILEYCSETLSEATPSEDDRDKLQSPSAKLLSRKLDFYSRLVNAYDIIDSVKVQDNEQSQEMIDTDFFTEEAKGWIKTYETVTGSTIVDEGAARKAKRLGFTTFASSFIFPSKDEHSKQTMQIYFSDSTRTRCDALVHVFQPLLGWFSSGIVSNFFDMLGIKEDNAYIQKCFGEWFMTLSGEQMVQHGLSLPDSPINRFIEDVAGKQGLSDVSTPLEALFTFCCESEDLIRAFILATLCRRAVVKASGRIENISQGKVSLRRLAFDWEVLLRKCRVCLLARLRLHGEQLGALPLSVYNLEVENEFSIFEWLARDELKISHGQEELVILEEACRMSSFSFDPSTEHADRADRVSTLHTACIKGQTVLEGDDLSSSTLLLYFPHHNKSTVLAAHRSLILASSWLKQPENLALLASSLEAAKCMNKEPSLAFAIRLELWTRVVCPVYRARLFGFTDVPELVEEDFGPLLQRPRWLEGFGQLSLRILNLVTDIEWREDLSTYKWPESDDNDEWWPPLQPDFILDRAIRKIRPLDKSSRDAHYVVICGLLVSNDMNALAPCVPAIYDCFQSLSIFNPVTPSPSPSPEQDTFLASAILLQARNYSGPPLDNFHLGELAVLGEKWGFSSSTLRSLYLLAMYEFGKDPLVDDLLTRAFPQIDSLRFLDGGLDILCRRLDTFFQSDFMKTRHMREVMGVLDADLCDWIQQQAGNSEETSMWVFPDPTIGLNLTHIMALRLLSLSKIANVDTTLRVKVHSLAVLSGTLLKEVEESRRQKENKK